MEGFECCGDGRESDRRLGFEIEYEEVVAADRLKAIRRKLVPADNLKRSVAKALLLKSKSVSSEKVLLTITFY
ncbi:hypothetical protein L1987_54562 [Smallanthus sonchifolius]|uniref:Uncharacterized protein n=1 Tax=Smallanthus sonchifolius TaxID=185202 RepID=A0ACB9E7J3_9ASTR|nr:hypothetical protein L1987_54562 [Smallanthus sonchifolius]